MRDVGTFRSQLCCAAYGKVRIVPTSCPPGDVRPRTARCVSFEQGFVVSSGPTNEAEKTEMSRAWNNRIVSKNRLPLGWVSSLGWDSNAQRQCNRQRAVDLVHLFRLQDPRPLFEARLEERRVPTPGILGDCHRNPTKMVYLFGGPTSTSPSHASRYPLRQDQAGAVGGGRALLLDRQGIQARRRNRGH